MATKTVETVERLARTALSAFLAVVLLSPVWTNALADYAAGKPIDVPALRVAVLGVLGAAAAAAVNAVVMAVQTWIPWLPSPLRNTVEP